MVSVKHADGSAGGYFVKPSTTVFELKERIADRTDADPDEFYLVLSVGRTQQRLEGKKTMADYGVGEDATLRVAIDPRRHAHSAL